MMKKAFSLLAALLLCVALLTACGSGAANDSAPKKTLYEQGLDVVSLLAEMAGSENYFSLYSGSAELRGIVSAAGEGDYAAPRAVYQLVFSGSTLPGMDELSTMDGLPDTLKKYLDARTQAVLASQLNAIGGVNMVAASSICTAGKAFVSDEAAESALYLYTYENGLPVLIAFTAGEGGAFYASGSFIFYEGFRTSTEREIKQSLTEIGADAEVIRK